MSYEKDVHVFTCMIHYNGRKIDMNEISNLIDDGRNFLI